MGCGFVVWRVAVWQRYLTQKHLLRFYELPLYKVLNPEQLFGVLATFPLQSRFQ